MYLFRVTPASDFTALLPAAENVITAWVDEGERLVETPAEIALAHGQSTHDEAPNLSTPRGLSSQQRRQMMARSVLFSVTQLNDDEIEVYLVSRSLIFSPKGDREVTERWQRTGDSWYSAYQPD